MADSADPVPAPVIDIESWGQFVDYADSLKNVGAPSQTPYLFRGHSDQSWSLRPSLLREVGNPGVSASRAIEIEKEALAEFRRQAHLYVRDELLTDTETLLAWWTVMQHHGAPTRLLDWTRSPYVGAYFTVRRDFDRPGIIWIFHVDTVDSKRKAANNPDFHTTPQRFNASCQDPNAPAELLMIRRPRETERMVVQQGVFTVSPQILADHGHIIASCQAKDDSRQFFGIRVRPKLKLEFLRRLSVMNVTGRALFPGIDGLGLSVAEIVRLEGAYQEKPR
jgi:FRG domain-containing protein